MTDRLARVLASVALTLALVGLVVAGYAVALGRQYLEDVRDLGEAMERSLRDAQGRNTLPMRGPPPELDSDY
jgi:hypothetical protein